MDKHLPEHSRILIVDDTVQNIQVLGTVLKQEGYQINVAQDGLQALEMVRKIPPDLILLDVMMPELDGFATCERLKNAPETAELPVIFLTAKAELNHVIKGFQLGAVDYITKPFNPMELLARVRTQLDLKHSRDLIQTASQERKELLHILCHDLANPISAILSVLKVTNSWENYQRMQGLMEHAAENALSIIQLVREMRHLEERGLRLECLDLAASVNKSHELLAQKFRAKDLAFENGVEPGLKVIAEPVSLVNSVLNNILTNAVKFSFRGDPVTVSAEKVPDGVALRVTDRGTGIPEPLLDKLFDMRQTTSREGTEGEEGTGFGMPMIQKFAEAYGGSVRVFSKTQKNHPDDHGTTIVVILPRCECP